MKIVVGTVRELGLQVAPHKTEAIFVYDRRRGAAASGDNPGEDNDGAGETPDEISGPYH